MQRISVLVGLMGLSVHAAPFPWAHDTASDALILPKGSAPAPYATDWNEDGRVDLVVGLQLPTQSGGIAVHLQKAGGTFETTALSAFSSGDAATVGGASSFYRPVVVDWNGDGKKDLIFGQHQSAKGVFFCPNEGSHAQPVFHGVNCRAMTTAQGALVGALTTPANAYLSPEVLDWEGDGDWDLLVATSAPAAVTSRGVKLYLNVGTATAPSLQTHTWILKSDVAYGLADETTFEPDAVDIDDDGDLDLMLAGQTSSAPQTMRLWQCLNTGTRTAPIIDKCTSLSLPVSGLIANVIDFVHVDGDGYLDLLRGLYSGFISNTVTYYHGRSPDKDGDGVPNTLDNCPDIPNPATLKLDRQNPVQLDLDQDGIGTACDADDDGDNVADNVDNCPYRANPPPQTDADNDGRGDFCDPLDNRPASGSAKLSYDYVQAQRVEWGRRPAIIMRADAMSVSFRYDVATKLTEEVLRRNLPFTLAIIPWTAAHFLGTPSAQFLAANAGNPNLELAQHGTYHECMNTATSKRDEFKCDMNATASTMLMRAGLDSMTQTVSGTSLAFSFVGFIPPGDAYDDAALEAAASLGYKYFGSAYWAEHPKFIWTDARGLLHLPWSQTACGNGGSPWLNCATTSIEAHTGPDCSLEHLCKPTRDQRSYDPWSKFSANTLAARCRHDIEVRYGLCSIIFELSSYDKADGTGTLDPVAFEGFKVVLDDLQALAKQTDAEFMTLSDFAAAQRMRAQDTKPPTIVIHAPAAGAFTTAEVVTVSVAFDDDLSGIYAREVTLNGSPIAPHQQLRMADLGVGDHLLVAMAEDFNRNKAETSVRFTVSPCAGPSCVPGSVDAGTPVCPEGGCKVGVSDEGAGSTGAERGCGCEANGPSFMALGVILALGLRRRAAWSRGPGCDRVRA